jgi:hypothetical protein
MDYDEILRLLNAQSVTDDGSDQVREIMEVYKQISTVLGKRDEYCLISAPTVNFELDLHAISSTKSFI